MSQTFTGQAISPGQAIGRIVRRRALTLEGIERELTPELTAAAVPDHEQVRLDRAVGLVREKVEARRQNLIRLGQTSEAQIFEAHGLLLSDPEWIGSVADEMRGGVLPAERALARVTQGWIAQFESMEDELFRARAADLKDLWAQLHRALQGKEADVNSVEESLVLWT